jgi:hypothetical protein
MVGRQHPLEIDGPQLQLGAIRALHPRVAARTTALITPARAFGDGKQEISHAR